MKKIYSIIALMFLSGSLFAQYNRSAGSNAPVEYRKVEYYDAEAEETRVRVDTVSVQAARDNYGNASSSDYDLAVDGAFEGQTIVVLHLYTGEGFDFSKPKAALAQKGFSVYRYINFPPSADSLKAALDKACQLWVVSDSYNKLNQEHVAVIKDYFDAGHGVYIWGDNQPYYADANILARALVGTEMSGNDYGDQEIGVKNDTTNSGVLKNHLLTTGLEHIYEGITIASLPQHQSMTPLIWGSNGKIVASVYEAGNKRLIIDGGFTRLYVKWDTAGTGRYVKNAAAWLVNYERFGEEVLSETLKEGN